MIKSVKQIISSLPKILIDSIRVAFAILGGTGIVLSFTAFSWIGYSKSDRKDEVMV